MSSQTCFICVVFLFVTFKPVVAHKSDLHHQPYQDPVADDHQSTESHTEQMMIQVSSPACPQHCSCKMNGTHHITSVNCADGELTMVPDVPETTVDLYLKNNYISNINCTSFKHLFSLENLNLVLNQIGQQHLPPCVFVSQSSSLIHLDMSNNHIHELNVKLFQNLYHLETLNLSRNVITHLESRTFSGLVHLVNLNLSFNYIASIAPDAFTGLYSLRTLSLLNNRLDNDTSFHKDVFQDLGALEMLDVKANLGFCAVIYHRRWKLRYLYYIGHRRMHIGEQVIDYAPVADVFLTYDQDDLHWRRFMQRIFLPRLNQRNITYVLGETDFPGGDLMAHVTGAVVGTRKTVVLLSEDIFDDLNREYEINLSIMREMDTRSLKIVPIFVEEIDLALYPREIELFLRNQWERCLWYNDSKDFWDAFGKAVRENK